MRNAIIVDLDGTLCNTDHRQHFMQQEKKNWVAFYEALLEDAPHKWCIDLVSRFSHTHSILFVSGRPDDYFSQTIEWLNLHLPQPMTFKLWMRKSGDYRKDCIVKEEIYREAIEPDYDVLFCVDDRKQVVDMWRSIGLTCLQCAEGNF